MPEKKALPAIKIFREGRRPHVQLKLAVTSRQITTQDRPGHRLQRVRVKRRTNTPGSRHRKSGKTERQRHSRMKIEPLNNGWRNDRAAPNIVLKRHRILDRFFS